MDQTTKATCWKCKDIFTIILKQQDYVSPNRVAKLVPCPYCGAECKITIHENQVPSVQITRGGGSQAAEKPWGDLLTQGALTDQVFDSTPDDQSSG